ncbi:MAG: phosphatase PAP2 family protein [Chitinophagaceae bacterium]|nr:phosphatase PAP2 family protein [Chitinophagaceae bacterium]
MVKDTMPKVDIGEITVHRPALKKGMILVPLTMIAYGALSLDNGELKAIDREVKEELWLEKSHKPLKIDNYLQWAPAAAVYGLNAVGIKGRHNFKDRSIIYGMSMAFMSGTVFATKHLSKQLRPDDSNNQSFPSGHTANAFAGAEFLRREYWDTSPWIGVAGYAVAGITGYLRMYNNRHWMSDVVAGAGVGILSTNLAYYLYPTVKKVFSGKKENNSNIVAPFYNQGAVGLSLVHNF